MTAMVLVTTFVCPPWPIRVGSPVWLKAKGKGPPGPKRPGARSSEPLPPTGLKTTVAPLQCLVDPSRSTPSFQTKWGHSVTAHSCPTATKFCPTPSPTTRQNSLVSRRPKDPLYLQSAHHSPFTRGGVCVWAHVQFEGRGGMGSRCTSWNLLSTQS